MYDSANHFSIKELPWDEAEAKSAINSIVKDAIGPIEAGSLPRHPMDGYGVKSDMYMGTSGLIWGIDYLHEVSATNVTFDSTSHLDGLLSSNKKDYEGHMHRSNSSYLFGPLPILMQKYKKKRDSRIAEDIYNTIGINNVQPVRELMWGMAGTMLAAVFMSHWTGESRWQEIFSIQADALLADLEEVEGVGYIWTQDLYGAKSKYLGPVHGFAGNVIPFVEGAAFLTKDAYLDLVKKVMNTVVNTAVVDERYANWSAIYEPSTATPPRLVQHCHGAAGMITALAKLPAGVNPAFDLVLEKAGELVWCAGALKKGANLCHGTAGNGYALLKLYERTHDAKWLDRARIFAMNSIEQYRITKRVFHQGRYTLWTGDIGTAIYLWDCINAEARFPTIDVF